MNWTYLSSIHYFEDKLLTMLVKTLTRILFLDIETVSGTPGYNELDITEKDLWQQKSKYWLKDVENPIDEDFSNTYSARAGIYAEFGKVVCISMGIILTENQKIHSFRLNSLYGKDENEILQNFADILDKFYPDPEKNFICGHNIREFDIPFLARRMIIQGIKLPGLMDISGKKPWETKHLLDTLEMWKFGDYKNYTSLKLLAHILGFPSPKDDIDGSQVGAVYYEEDDMERIRKYCEKDVVTTAQVFLKLNHLEPIKQEQIIKAG